MKTYFIISTNFIPSKTLLGIRNNFQDETIKFIVIPYNIAEKISQIEESINLEKISDEEIEEKLTILFDWIEKLIKKEKNNEIYVIMEKFSPQINYYIYGFIKKKKLKLLNEIY